MVKYETYETEFRFKNKKEGVIITVWAPGYHFIGQKLQKKTLKTRKREVVKGRHPEAVFAFCEKGGKWLVVGLRLGPPH